MVKHSEVDQSFKIKRLDLANRRNTIQTSLTSVAKKEISTSKLNSAMLTLRQRQSSLLKLLHQIFPVEAHLGTIRNVSVDSRTGQSYVRSNIFYLGLAGKYELFSGLTKIVRKINDIFPFKSQSKRLNKSRECLRSSKNVLSFEDVLTFSWDQKMSPELISFIYI
jgi:hypothetical protein